MAVVANCFSVPSLENTCCDVLKSHLGPENCLGIILVTRHIPSCSRLYNSAKSYTLKHFQHVLRLSQEFQEIYLKNLKELIDCDELNVKREEVVFEAILRWINYAPEERKEHIAILLPKVRLGFIASDYITDEVKTNPLVMENESCAAYISNATEALFGIHNLGASDTVLQKQLLHPRLPPAILLAIGGWSNNHPTSRIEAYDVRANCWKDVYQANEMPRGCHGTVILGDSAYCVGGVDGSDELNTVRIFNIATSTWHQVTNMTVQRCSVSVALLDGLIYAIGGHNRRRRLNSAERYDPQTRSWTTIASMNECRSEASATTLNGKVYICGGFSGRETLFTAEIYDPQTNQWSFIAPMMNRRHGLGVIAYGDLAYAVGGDGDTRTVEAYDPRTDRWHEVEPMITGRSDFGIEVLDDRIFVVGGLRGSSYCSDVECYDMETNTWSTMRNMALMRRGLSLCVLPEVIVMSQEHDSD